MALTSLTSHQVLMALAYALLFVATVPALDRHEGFAWALLPIACALVGHSASVLKNLSTSKESKSRFDQVAWLAWIVFYSVCLVWPFTVQWFDILVVAALFLEASLFRDSLLIVYYSISASHYMEHGNVLQVVGRLLLAQLLMTAAFNQKADTKETTTDLKGT